MHTMQILLNVALPALMIIPLLMILWSLFMLFRNDWVYKVRTRILHEDMDRYMRLPSYEGMLYKFWVWDVERFIR